MIKFRTARLYFFNKYFIITERINQLRSENANTTMPSITSTIPVARFKVFADALFAKTAAILAQRSVNAIHKSSTNQSGFPPMAKCEAAPVKAVNAMINTLVQTAVLSS